MDMKFITNNYLIAWNVLFNKNIIDTLIEIKKRIINTYRSEWNIAYGDKDKIIRDPQNFIPNNDILYNAILEQDEFNAIVKNAEKARINIIKIWDKNKKNIDYLVNKVIRKPISSYDCFIINKEFNVNELIKVSDNKGILIIGKNYNNENDYLINFFNEILKQEINIKEVDNLNIKEAILEMAVLNEFATILNGVSYYKYGNSSYFYLKRQIYPYWLMYLGIQREDMVKYMTRDNITFDVNNFAYEKELIHMNIEEFIDFIIRNQRYIIRTHRLAETEEII